MCLCYNRKKLYMVPGSCTYVKLMLGHQFKDKPLPFAWINGNGWTLWVLYRCHTKQQLCYDNRLFARKCLWVVPLFSASLLCLFWLCPTFMFCLALPYTNQCMAPPYLSQEEEAQIAGVVLLSDLQGLGWKHVRRINPLYVKRIMGLLQVL